jgi:hypothetical protein
VARAVMAFVAARWSSLGSHAVPSVVILSPSAVFLSAARNLKIWLRAGFAKDLRFWLGGSSAKNRRFRRTNANAVILRRSDSRKAGSDLLRMTSSASFPAGSWGFPCE